ncbi:MAG: alpha/beta hydrolase [Gammaproteobacteria bacterium]|nr:alpha/beta hydrolase [Gammaproteobacteria bacterium]
MLYFLKIIFSTLVLSYAVLFLFAYFFSDGMIFFPPRAGYKATKEFVQLKTATGDSIFAVYLPNPNAKYTVIISHGNAEDIGYTIPFLRKFQEHGFAVLSYDYPGYGHSSGRPNEVGCYAAVNAVYQYAINDLKIPPTRIISYGRSLGGAMALDLAIHHPVAGVILESAFTSAFRVATRIKIFPIDKFNNLRKIKSLKYPLLVIHGEHDNIIAFWHGQKLFAKAPLPKKSYWVKNSNHNDVSFIAGDEYWRTLVGFTDTLSSRE